MSKSFKVAIIGAGVSGVVASLHLSALGVSNILFEKKESVVNGPPFCHLHVGGNLYPDISDNQCRMLMKQSIEMARLFPHSIDQRPTFISIPKTEKYKVSQITDRLDMLVSYYKSLIDEDPKNKILGEPSCYYKVYKKEQLLSLLKEPTVKTPKTADQWITNAVKILDLDKLKMPIILVQEHGWNLFRLGAQAQLALKETPHTTLKLNTTINNVVDVREKMVDHNWELYANDTKYKVDYIINCCGYKTGAIDDILNIDSERLIEFKAAYVTKWSSLGGLIPELIFHGERGTPHGMAQLTPYCDDYYQIHGMTEEITLFKDGLVESETGKAQPEFNQKITDKLTKGWIKEEINKRSKKSINYVANFVPKFSTATVGAPPLFGAQQIPGDDPNLRVGEVSFATNFYARSEIVKASSALTVANQIVEDMIGLKLLSINSSPMICETLLSKILKSDIDNLAAELATSRNYPKALSKLLIDKNV